MNRTVKELEGIVKVVGYPHIILPAVVSKTRGRSLYINSVILADEFLSRRNGIVPSYNISLEWLRDLSRISGNERKQIEFDFDLTHDYSVGQGYNIKINPIRKTIVMRSISPVNGLLNGCRKRLEEVGYRIDERPIEDRNLISI